MAGCSCSCSIKALMWWCWAVHAIISATYLGLCVTSGNNISRTTILGSNGDLYKSGLMACVVLSFIVVFFYLIASPVIMLGRVFGADLTLSYGVLLGSGWNAAWVVLLSGLVLNAAKDMATNLNNNKYWSDSDYSAFQATYAFAYIMCGSFVILTVLLFFGRRAFGTTAGAAAATTGGEAYKPSVGAAMNSSGPGMELPPSKSNQWPPPSGGAAATNTGAWSGWNGGTNV